jgi:hypothetical protein
MIEMQHLPPACVNSWPLAQKTFKSLAFRPSAKKVFFQGMKPEWPPAH